jgi:hypothetical protein
MNGGILQQIVDEKAWEAFLAHRLMKGRFNWRSFQEADTYVGEHLYIPEAERIADGESLGIPERIVVNKMGTGKKRIVYRFQPERMRVLKLIAHLLYRYDGIFSPNCYAFRRGVRPCDAINRINKDLRGKRMWAYKVDIHDYFNSISIPILLPMLADILKDVIGAYRSMISDQEMKLFYSVVMSERSINPAAAEIMIRETQTMIGATKLLFYAIQAKGVAKFDDPDAAAFSFAMGVHSILNYEMDLLHAGEKPDTEMMDGYIDEFARVYGEK